MSQTTRAASHVPPPPTPRSCAFLLSRMSTDEGVLEMLRRQGVAEEFRPSSEDGALSWNTISTAFDQYTESVNSKAPHRMSFGALEAVSLPRLASLRLALSRRWLFHVVPCFNFFFRGQGKKSFGMRYFIPRAARARADTFEMAKNIAAGDVDTALRSAREEPRARKHTDDGKDLGLEEVMLVTKALWTNDNDRWVLQSVPVSQKIVPIHSC